MSTTDSVLPSPLAHRFTDPDLDPERIEHVESAYERLTAMDLGDRAKLEAFLEAWNEASAFISETGARLRLSSARSTDRQDYRDRFLAFNREITPRVSQREHELGQKCLASPAIEQHCRRIPRILVSVAQGDSFQHWLYTHADHTQQERRDRWDAERRRFAGHIDTDGLDPGWLGASGHQILHFFSVPFYFIEYGFAYLGALQVAANYEEDPQGALAAYKHALSLGAQRDTAGLYAAAGAQFVPTREKLRELMGWIRASSTSDGDVKGG